MYACNGILFNHESPRRGETFVTRKITRGFFESTKVRNCIYLGNIDALRDWGHAKDYVEMQWKMLQLENPEDFVIATGRQESVRRFLELAAIEIGWGGLIWQGKGTDEVGIRKDNGQIVVRIDPIYYRPSDVQELLGDPTKANKKLNWQARCSLEELVAEMIEVDKKIAKRDLVNMQN